ncbi:MAG: sugar phosphate isomerase/epimerase [Anaerolineae bacterium]|nr:sugar phosphate isomerase/epimerase [Anaerolineae bacterium]MCB9130686.1 sugar phosphate isomerase/epimerase [Anaerolineales bacterium]MCB0240825.1 sugar phosphate isomerase/epimerase [Anaerolineae bacterium]MCB0246646.1 sugar phosphate isomerase/epimerase [Anaerolineae bacterium]MCB0248643.1 sugar phosphate isomerase/epimerase [Anaerolineae bacterium]
MSLPIALQTYTVREQLARDFERTITRVAEIGYPALEITIDIPGASLSQAEKVFGRLGLQTPAAHSPLPLGDKRSAVLDFAAMFGVKTLGFSGGPKEFGTVDSIRQLCGRINDAYEVVAASGIALAYHNHWWEFARVEDRLGFDIMLELLDPGVVFEVDTYWVKTGGQDPTALVKKLGDRAPLLHIKDGPATEKDPMVAVGQGVMDFPAIIPAATGAQWLIVELDRCATDMMVAVDESYRYLTGEGLAHGR